MNPVIPGLTWNPAKPTMASFELTGKQLLKQSAWKMERSAD
jgi:hypothetical protein